MLPATILPLSGPNALSSSDSTCTWFFKERNPSISSVTDEVPPDTPDAISTKSNKESLQVKWHTATISPSEIHTELLKKEIISDPYIGFNEHKVQWIGEREWLYACVFDYERNGDSEEYVLLEILGLDTLCDVYLVRFLLPSAPSLFVRSLMTT
jgi:beta-mannosidase